MVRERGERPQVKDFLDTDEGPPPLPEPINWWNLDPESRKKTLEVLSAFVVDLTTYYVLPEQVVPRCWYKHSALIQELLALFQYRNQQQYAPGASVQGAIDFHTQFVQNSIPRLRGWVAEMGCTASEHFPDEGRLPSWVSTEGIHRAVWKTDFHEHLQLYEQEIITDADTEKES